MAQLRRKGANKKAGELFDRAVQLQRETRDDPISQLLIGAALPSLDKLEIHTAELVAAEDVEDVDATLTTRTMDDLRRLAAAGNEDAVSEMCRRPLTAAAA